MVGNHIREGVRIQCSDRESVYLHIRYLITCVWRNGERLIGPVIDRSGSLRGNGSVCPRRCRDGIGFEIKSSGNRGAGIHGYCAGERSAGAASGPCREC